MKKVFKKSYMLKNGGCYSEKKMGRLTALRPNLDDDVFIHEILDSPVPLYDKYYFVFKHCEVQPLDVFNQLVELLSCASEYYNDTYPDSEICNILESFVVQYTTTRKVINYAVLEDRQKRVEAIGVDSKGDDRFACLGVYAFIDMIDAIEKDEPFQNVLDEAYVAVKSFTRLLVSRKDLKEKLLKDLKEFTT